MKEGWSELRRHAAERDHRFREHDPDLVGLFDGRNFTRRTGADDPQRRARWRSRLSAEVCGRNEQERGGTGGTKGHEPIH